MDNVLITGEHNYNIDINNYNRICNTNKMVKDIRCPGAICKHSRVSQLKLIDIHNLLKKAFWWRVAEKSELEF